MLGEQNGRRDHLRTIGVTQEENEMSLPRVHWGEREVDRLEIEHCRRAERMC